MSSYFFSRIARPWLRQSKCQFSVVQLRHSSTTGDIPHDLKPVSAIPGLKGLPLIGNIRQLWRDLNKGREQNIFPSLNREFGPTVKLNLAGEVFVVVSDPEATEEMFPNEGEWPSRGSFEKNIKRIRDKIKCQMGYWRKIFHE